MLESLIQIDHQLFHLINVSGQHPIFDGLMPLLRNKYFWGPLYLFLVAYILLNHKKEGWLLVVFVLLVVVCTDQFSSGLIKPLVQRFRPCHQPGIQPINVLVHCGGGYSFISSHATNHFGVAVFLGLLFNRPLILVAFLVWAASIAYAQVYVGVHFPADVFAGSLAGAAIGHILWRGCRSLVRKYYPQSILSAGT